MFDRADFQRLAELLAGIKGRFLLSLNDVPDVRRIFGGFHLAQIETRYGIGGDKTAGRAELLIANYPLETTA